MIGERIHNYEINAHLGSGGMGNVFRAVDNNLGREVALKMLHPQLTVQPLFLERFKKEARILAQLLHPNIAVIYNFIEHGGNHFMVMEYVEGTSLDDLLKKYGILPAGFVVPVFVQALEGLQHAHRKNILHRDIKPANLMITLESTLKLMDFGIAKVAGEQKMTQVNKIVGTIEFMAPELIEGQDASAASDIYAMGATLYELVSGKIPFEGDTDFTIMQSILKSKVKPPEKLNASVPKALSEIILKAMNRNPEQRYPSARAFQHALITAFPNYKEINVDALGKPQPNVYTKAVVKPAPAATKVVDAPTMIKRIELAKPFETVHTFTKKVISSKQLSLLALVVLFVIIGILVVAATWTSTPEQTVIAQKDSSIVAVQQPSESADSHVNTGSLQESIPLPQTDNRIPVAGEAVIDNNEIPVAGEKQDNRIKELPVVTEERSKKKNKTNSKEEVEVKSVENDENVIPPVTAPPVKKEIYVSSEVMVNLSLASSPDMNQKKKETQAVDFTVTRPVFYEGVLIIRQGARASGSLTIGRVRTDVQINRVEAANGMSIPLKAERAHGKRADIESHDTFNAIVQKGTRLSF